MSRQQSALNGVVVAVVAIATTTGVIYAVREVAPVESTGVLYLLAVLLVSSYWGIGLGVATAIGSAAAWNFFHIPPVHQFTIADGENWVALGVFVAAAGFASALAQAARARALEAERRRREADLLIDLAGVLLGSADAEDARALMAARLAAALGLGSATVELRTRGGDDRHLDIPLRADGDPIGTLLVPRDSPEETLETLRRLAAPLAALLATARSRDRLAAEVVETEALRRSDVIKTALLRAISHDLRSPLTAIVTAAGGLGTAGTRDAAELASVIQAEATRLSSLVDDLLDLSRLETGAAAPRLDWCSIEEVIESALAAAPDADDVQLRIEPELPLVQADAAQLERVLANLLDNARRHAEGEPVTVQARRAGHNLRVRVTDRGPGIPAGQLERIFEPFQRAEGAAGGSGLGLAIARGFAEANGGRLWAESLPGQGATFVLELPVRVRPRQAAPR